MVNKMNFKAMWHIVVDLISMAISTTTQEFYELDVDASPCQLIDEIALEHRLSALNEANEFMSNMNKLSDAQSKAMVTFIREMVKGKR